MKLLLVLLFTLSLFAQSTGTVVVASNITATAGTLSCTGTATIGVTTSTMQLKCLEGTITLIDYPFTVTAAGATVYSITRGTNVISWILTKGNPTPDQWQVSANGVAKSGTF